jgi:hypothetical protein
MLTVALTIAVFTLAAAAGVVAAVLIEGRR